MNGYESMSETLHIVARINRARSRFNQHRPWMGGEFGRIREQKKIHAFWTALKERRQEASFRI